MIAEPNPPLIPMRGISQQSQAELAERLNRQFGELFAELMEKDRREREEREPE